MLSRFTLPAPRRLARWLGYALLLVAPGSSVLLLILLLAKLRKKLELAALLQLPFGKRRPLIAALLMLPIGFRVGPDSDWGCRVLP